MGSFSGVRLQIWVHGHFVDLFCMIFGPSPKMPKLLSVNHIQRPKAYTRLCPPDHQAAFNDAEHVVSLAPKRATRDLVADSQLQRCSIWSAIYCAHSEAEI